jgi:hypothetical protein
VFVVGSHVSPLGQSLVDTHCTHLSLAASHTGVPPVHAVWFVAVHVTQLPPGPHALPCEFPAHSLSCSHPRHVFAVPASPVLHTGVGLLHSESSTHCTHVWFAVSHTPLEQSASTTQATHAPMAVSQTWLLLVLQSAFEVHARHACDVASQTGLVEVLQSVFAMQPTHVDVTVSHTAVGATHAACCVASHWTHRPAFVPPVSHTGVAPVQSVVLQPRQVFVVESQMGVVPLQFAFDPHCTQRPAFAPVVSHTGVEPVQSPATHARHVCAVVSQMGVAPLHWAFDVHAGGGLPVMHWPLALS